eukprot:gene10339-7233_t
MGGKGNNNNNISFVVCVGGWAKTSSGVQLEDWVQVQCRHTNGVSSKQSPCIYSLPHVMTCFFFRSS